MRGSRVVLVLDVVEGQHVSVFLHVVTVHGEAKDHFHTKGMSVEVFGSLVFGFGVVCCWFRFVIGWRWCGRVICRSRWSGGVILWFRVVCWCRCGISRPQMEDLLQGTSSDLGRGVALELVDRGWCLYQFSRVRLGMMHGLMRLMMHWTMWFVMDVMNLMMFAMHNRVMAHMTDSMAHVVITGGNAH